MPGFNIGTIGGGYGADSPTNNLEVRRKHRWVFQALHKLAGGGGAGNTFSQKSLLVLQSASRPSFKFEEPEMHHNQEVARFAGKQDWDPVTLVWYDVEQDPDISREVYGWLESVVNMHTIAVNSPSIYKAHAELRLLNGIGSFDQFSESWTMHGTWPAAINWQELDYTSTDLLACEATMRFDRATRVCGPSSLTSYTGRSCP